MKNKKAFLLAEETLKVIISVIVIVFLVYFLVSIYMAKVNGDKLPQATALLKDSENSINVIINNLSEGQTKTKDVIEPKGWYIFSFTGSEVKPNLCAGSNCLCVCDDAFDLNGRFNRQQKKCDEKGVCLVENELGEFEDIKITGQLKVLSITKYGGKIYIK